MGEQSGYTLTELLVALMISVTIILGAGQLFLSTLATFRQVDVLGRQQESLMYITTLLTDTLRRHHALNDNGEPLFHLQCTTLGISCRCTIQDMRESQPLISFDKFENTACERDEPLGLAKGSSEDVSVVTLPLGPQGREVSFNITRRERVLRR